MQQHTFGFGTAVKARLLGITEEEWQALPNWAKGETTWQDLLRYRAMVAANFNKVVLENDLKWAAWEEAQSNDHHRFRQSWTDRALDWLAERGIQVRGHYGAWGNIQGPDDWNHNRDTSDGLDQRLMQHLRRKLPAIGARVQEWDGINHPIGWSGDTLETRYGADLNASIIKEMKRLYLQGEFWLNEDQNLPGGSRIDAYTGFIERMLERDAPVDGIGFQGHFRESTLTGIPELARRLDHFAQRLPRLQITELDVDTTDRQLQADYLRDVLTIAFSHPALEGVLHLSLDGPEVLVNGSLVADLAGRDFAWIASGEPLPAGDYTLRLRSAEDAFADQQGNLLDGNADGTPGDDYQMRFTVTAPEGVIVSLPDFTRGPGQLVQVPNTGYGLPLSLRDAQEVTSVRLEIAYDPALLHIEGARPSEELPEGAQVEFDTTTPGTAALHVQSPAPLDGVANPLVWLTVSVPETATLGVAHRLVLQQVQVNHIPAIGDTAVHRIGYLGDSDGDGRHTVQDVVALLQLVAGRATGCAAWPRTDPHLLGEVTGDGRLTVGDVSLLLAKVAGRSVPAIPGIP